MHMRESIAVLISCALITFFAAPPSLRAQQRVVSPTDIHKELVQATATRRQNRAKVRELFSSEVGQKALASAKVDSTQVIAAVSTLSNAELAELAARAGVMQQDFAAGRLSERDILIIILGIAALILIIVAVR